MNKTPDKYKLYLKSVQAPSVDADFFFSVYKEHRGKKPKIFREDFCGTFALCCEWVKKNPQFVAHGVDLDPEPINWGFENNFKKLSADQRTRVHIHKKNVLSPSLPPADLIAAQNFSFFLFKTRKELLKYFRNSYKNLNENGVFIADCFGGTHCFEPNEEETKHRGYSYFWDQATYDPLTHEALFYIHFKIEGYGWLKKAFTYDWRMWSIPEIREVMSEAGFKKTFVYWEGTTKSGEGDGNFKIVDAGEACDSWIAYVVGLK